MELAEKIREFAEEAITDPRYFVVEVLASGSGRTISVLMDGDEGIPISECGRISRAISHRIDEDIPDDVGAFTVEVSSPGVDRPLRMLRQVPKHIGRRLQFTAADGKSREGKLLGIENEELELEEEWKEKGKKKQLLVNRYLWKEMHDPRVVVSFKL